MSLDDEDEDDHASLAPKRSSIWDDPRQPPENLPVRMGTEELMAWYSYHIRDESIPLSRRMRLAETYAKMLRLIGPSQVTNVLNQSSTHVHPGMPGSMAPEEARALVARLGDRFRQLPPASPPRILSSTSRDDGSIPAVLTSIPSSKKP